MDESARANTFELMIEDVDQEGLSDQYDCHQVENINAVERMSQENRSDKVSKEESFVEGEPSLVYRATVVAADSVGNADVLEQPAGTISMRHRVNIELHLKLDYQVMKKRNTIYSRFLSPRAIQFMYRYVWNNRFSSVITYLICTFLAVHSILYLSGTMLLPLWIYALVQSVFTVHLIICCFASINIAIMKHAVKSFNFWYVFLHILVTCTCLIYLWDGNIYVILGCLHFFSSCFQLILIDSYIFSNPTPIKVSCLMGLVSLFVLFYILKFLPDIALPFKSIEYQGIILLNFKSQATDSILVIIFYIIRVLVFKLMRDHRSMSLLEDHYTMRLSKDTPISRLPSFFSKSFKIDSPPTQNLSKSNNKINPIQHSGVNHLGSIQSFLPIQPANEQMDINKQVENQLDIPEDAKQNPKYYLIFGIYKEYMISLNQHQTIYHMYLQDRFPSIKKVMSSRIYEISAILINILSPALSAYLLFVDEYPISIKILIQFWMSSSIIIYFAQIMLTANMLMVKRMLLSFDYWYVTWLLIQVAVSGGILVNFDWRLIIWIWYFVNAQWYMFIDSFPPKIRQMTYFFVFYGIVIGLFMTIVCKFGFGFMFADNVVILWGDIELVDVRSTCSGSMFSWCLFMTRFLYGYWRNPMRSQFVTRKLRVSTIQELVQENEDCK